MKVKLDFVTNSSSTSFVLSSILSGKIDVIPTENLREAFKDLFPYDKFDFEDDEKQSAECYEFITRTWCTFEGIIKNEDYEDDDDMHGKFSVGVHNTTDWNSEREISYPISAIGIQVTSPQLYCQRNDPVVFDRTIAILRKILMIKGCENINGELYYIQYPSSYSGAGLDGGDPMGPYAWSYDILRCETKKGKIIVKNGRVISRVKWILCKEGDYG